MVTRVWADHQAQRRADLRPRRITVVVGIALVLLMFIPPSRASAHAGYHWTGAESTSQRFGAFAYLTVSNPSVPKNTGDHFVARILASEPAGTTACFPGAAPWIEVGWTEVGWQLDGSGFSLRSIYTYDTTSCQWRLFTQYPIGTGSTINVRLVPHSSCNDQTGPCNWGAQLWWNGQWLTLTWALLPNTNTSVVVEEFGEIQNIDTGAHWQIATSATGNVVPWVQTQLRNQNGTWSNWTLPVVTIELNTAPYSTTWHHDWWQFDNFRT